MKTKLKTLLIILGIFEIIVGAREVIWVLWSTTKDINAILWFFRLTIPTIPVSLLAVICGAITITRKSWKWRLTWGIIGLIAAVAAIIIQGPINY
jgi:hypothetical protein